MSPVGMCNECNETPAPLSSTRKNPQHLPTTSHHTENVHTAVIWFCVRNNDIVNSTPAARQLIFQSFHVQVTKLFMARVDQCNLCVCVVLRCSCCGHEMPPHALTPLTPCPLHR